MQLRRRFKQIDTLDRRLLDQAERLRKEAEITPAGFKRDQLLRLARHAETGAHMSEWLASPGFAAAQLAGNRVA